ncbi:MAG: RNA polymerase sigma factor [Spirochaetes bacterium]|jgi:RNA polymerase sigma-70 factor (ECF subfamily)|nr:RNA polymerase sigma factor [Spirochaetota bacterium]
MGINVEEYYKKYGPMVLRRCRQILKDEDKALDAMQEVFVKLIRNRDRLTEEYPCGLLYRMATNVCINMIRTEKRRPLYGNETMLQCSAYRDDSEERFIARSMLDGLFADEKESTKNIAMMRYLDKMTMGDISRETGLSISGIRKRLIGFRARARSSETFASMSF